MAQRYEQFLNVASFLGIIYRRDVICVRICVRNGPGFSAYTILFYSQLPTSLVTVDFVFTACKLYD